MDLFIECPVCEQQFSTPPVPADQKVACPSCSRKFEISDARIITSSTEEPDQKRQVKPRLQVPAQFESSTDTSIESDDPIAEPETRAKPVTRKPILALQRKRRARRRLITTLTSSVILATIIGILAGLLYRQVQKNAIANNGTQGTVLAEASNDPVDSDEKSESAPADENKQDPSEPEKPVKEREKPIENIPPQKFEYLNRKATKERWNAVQPHLVGLKVFDGLGTHEAVGTIVDSRGWILTSYNAVKGASKIEVTASVNSIDDFWEAEPLTDLVRGFVATKEEDDLVLLAINRRFVVAFSIVQPATNNTVVPSEYLLQCAPPSRKNLYGGTEIKIKQRSNLDSLDTTGQSMARRQKLDGKNLTWLVTTEKIPTLPGTPIFKIDGDLAAINAFSARKQSYFLPVDQVKSLIAGADGEIQPLRKLGAAEGESGPVAVSTASDMYEPSVRLNRLAEACKVFNWVPKNREDYDVLKEFAEAYSVIEKYAGEKAGSTIPEEKKIIALKEQLELLLHRRAASFSIEDELSLVEMNKSFAGKSLTQADQRVPFFGEIHFVNIVRSQIVVKLRGTETYVNAAFIPSDDPMRMQTKWLFFARTPTIPLAVNYRISDSEIITAESVEELLNFGVQ